MRGAIAATNGSAGATGRGAGDSGDNVAAVGDGKVAGVLAAMGLGDDGCRARRIASLSWCTSNDAAVRK